jgi:hypothetical protein
VSRAAGRFLILRTVNKERRPSETRAAFRPVRFFRELRLEGIWEGSSEIQRMIIAGQLTRRGPAALA